MPFYEYECQACKFYMEVMQKITDAPLTKCPSCGKRALKKLVSAPVFRLKGGGWYETDFKSDKENKRNLVGADKEEAKPESKPEAKEAKPEAKEAKEPKEAKDTKETKEAKPAEPKAASGAKDAPARKSVSVPVRAGGAPARSSARSAGRKSAGKRRR
jgi:putative FmdB family regulatory protein